MNFFYWEIQWGVLKFFFDFFHGKFQEKRYDLIENQKKIRKIHLFVSLNFPIEKIKKLHKRMLLFKKAFSEAPNGS